MTDHSDVFLSYSRNDMATAVNFRGQLERCGLSVFHDVESIRAGDLWLERLQEAVNACSAFVVMVGRDGVRRWIGAETEVALSRYFGPHNDVERLPIFPILLGETRADTLPAFLRLFQSIAWNGTEPLPAQLLEQIRNRTAINVVVPFEGCPFVGLAAFHIDQAHLFFGRQKETLDALACFDTRRGHSIVRWLEINGNSGSGKSSLMNAGLLPLVDQGWLWPRTGYERWRLIGPMVPGEHPTEMLAEYLARTFDARMGEIVKELTASDNALRYWLRERKAEDTAFLLAIDQFEELFTFADPAERRRFDRLLAAALDDVDCPLFLISTVRSDFLDRFGEDLPLLVSVRNQAGRPWTLAPIGDEDLRKVIEDPARLACLDVSAVKEAMVAEARDEPGALPLVENALHWLWEQRRGDRLSGRLFIEQGGLAGILSRGADALLNGLGKPQRGRALEVLFRLVRVDPEGRQHARHRISCDEAIAVAGGGESGRRLLNRLAGERARDGSRLEGPLRLITVSEEGTSGAVGSRWVNLIHETLIRSKGFDAVGKPQPYWSTLWDYIEQHKERAAWLRRLKADTQLWINNGRRSSDQWSHERVREAVTALRHVGQEIALTDDERQFLGPIDPDAMLAEIERPDTNHRRRALIGERLSVLGDPRTGVGVARDGTPNIDWCPVTDGKETISIRSDPNDPGSNVVNTITHVLSPFCIARYPVTVTQYQAFVMSRDGWRNPRWWADDLYRDPSGDTYEFGPFSNHPAVYVSWFDAVAFCRWLSTRLQLAIQLPDEWQWQQAATGGNVRNAFPWGADWDPRKEPYRANTLESRLGRVTAVGMYPAGATRGGVLDMAGTVWEWCLNKFDAPEITWSRADDSDRRVLRGGAWIFTRELAYSMSRSWPNRYYRFDSIGFRVVCSSPSPRTDP